MIHRSSYFHHIHIIFISYSHHIHIIFPYTSIKFHLIPEGFSKSKMIQISSPHGSRGTSGSIDHDIFHSGYYMGKTITLLTIILYGYYMDINHGYYMDYNIWMMVIMGFYWKTIANYQFLGMVYTTYIMSSKLT